MTNRRTKFFNKDGENPLRLGSLPAVRCNVWNELERVSARCGDAMNRVSTDCFVANFSPIICSNSFHTFPLASGVFSQI